jgi:hypothetical protein
MLSFVPIGYTSIDPGICRQSIHTFHTYEIRTKLRITKSSFNVEIAMDKVATPFYGYRSSHRYP